MNKTIFLIFILFTTFVYAKINVIVSIAPQYTFVKRIGADMVNLTTMVKPGNSPHTYEPKPSQMKEISKADIYFSIGVEFEKAWLPRFANQNKKMQIFNLTDGIEKLEITQHDDEHENGKHENEHHDGDPHVWTSPANVKIIANNIYKYLLHVDKANEKYYKKNLDKFLSEIESTDQQIKNILKNTKVGEKFMVFHPSWGYFAQEYNLAQITVEVDGKSPKPKTLSRIMREAKKEDVKAIFVQPEFSDKTARTIANQLNINVIKASPLDKNWSQSLINLAKAIAEDK